ncbi:MAG TPA: hypothetical protein VFE50_22080 [Cyclobacteriaceae bacterium]|nr:hypothetical protein [Cyclobacteriaceae bacterium]
MESPKPAAKDKGGCAPLLIRVAIGVAVILAIDYGVTKFFESKYPHDIYTNPLIPFENYYLAPTDAFLASEGVTSEFTDDVGVTARFFVLMILPTACMVIIAIVLFIIPFTKKLLDYFWYAFGAVAILILIQSFFIPPVLTIFDRDKKVMTVYKHEWMMVASKTEIPFEKISDFTSETHFVSGFGHYDDIRYVDLFAIVDGERIFIADNQVGSGRSLDENAPLLKWQQQELDAAILALKIMIGKNPMGPPPELLQNGE